MRDPSGKLNSRPESANLHSSLLGLRFRDDGYRGEACQTKKPKSISFLHPLLFKGNYTNVVELAVLIRPNSRDVTSIFDTACKSHEYVRKHIDGRLTSHNPTHSFSSKKLSRFQATVIAYQQVDHSVLQ